MINHTKEIQLLDCTLRDGGYINDWDFSRELYDAVAERLQIAGVDIIELGIMGNHNAEHFKTKFRTLEEIPIPPKVPGSRSLFTVMMNGTEYRKLQIGPRQPGGVDALRYAFFKADWREAIDQMTELMEKGYKVFAQTMATFQYSDEELQKLVEDMNRIHPDAFYVVDSFGTFYPEDVRRLYALVNDALDDTILFGLHAHNNLQMANANVITFVNEAKDRDIAIDSSIYGMGRGAGNANTELIMHYLNRREKKYDEEIVWSLYSDYFRQLREEYAWGYLPEQFLVSAYETNPAYVWYMGRHGVTDFNTIKAVLAEIPDDKRYSLFKDAIDPILNKMER